MSDSELDNQTKGGEVALKRAGDHDGGAAESQLLQAASAFATAGDLRDLLQAIGDVLRLRDGVDMGAIGLHEVRRRMMVIYPAPAQAAGRAVPAGERLSADGEEFPLHETELSASATGLEPYLSPDLKSDHDLQLRQRFYRAGFRRYVSMPLVHREQLLGSLYACTRTAAPPDEPTVEYLRRLGMLLAPALSNYRTQDRLAKGDRRRATLIELSHAINTSLQLQPVLDSARQAIGQIEGHCVSIVALLDEDEHSLRAYWHPGSRRQAGETEDTPESIAVSATALSWVLEQRQVYESQDLQQLHGDDLPFNLDASLREAGVRRYVVAPMFVRGRIIGGLFFGTTDPHPALSTDLWLYENIALQLALAIDNAMQFEQLQALTDRLAQQNVYLREEIDTDHNVEGMIGRAPAMQVVFDKIARVAGTEAAVLINGQTGVGKELVARAIHAQSARADHPLVKVNCAAIPENLVESELFGHERGAFTSAVSKRIGRFELARDGTLFLDEVGELPPAMQAKLLRVLQDGEFERVGGTATIKTDARIIAATNRDLAKAIENGSFRSDLYYRLNVFPIEVPPLAQRSEDVPLLVESFIAQFSRRMGKHIEAVAPESLERLCRHHWPGNVRELRHVIERAMIMCDGPVLAIEAGALMQAPAAAAAPAPPAHAEAPAPAEDSSTLQDVEREHIIQVLQQTGGVIDGPRGAAVTLGLKPSTLRSRMKRLGISRRPGTAT